MGDKGHGFVEFEDPEDAKAAMQNMDGSELFGRIIRVNVARQSTMDKTKPVWETQADSLISSTAAE